MGLSFMAIYGKLPVRFGHVTDTDQRTSYEFLIKSMS
jgi:hypothetical protein